VLRASQALSADAELTLARARFIHGAAGGQYIPGSLASTFAGGVTYNTDRWQGAVKLRYFGPRPLTEDNSQRSDASILFNAQVGYAVSERSRFRLDVLNLFNRAVDDITYFYTSRLPGEPAEGVADKHFHPAEPRTFRLSMVITI
jgi:outer membrane receptor protein involved in Fe transport